MRESSELGDEDLLWAGACFVGGIAGQQQAPCGAVSASAVYLGLRNCCSLNDEQRARQSKRYAGQGAAELVKEFTEKYGSIICLNLVGVDFSKPEAHRQIREQSIFENRCDRYVQFVIEKLYELDEKRSTTEP
jgi:C_GCAxxG_C_C family probable redox protein